MRAQNLTKETITQVGVTDRGFPNFRVGDKVEVSLYVTEGKKERVQAFAGDVIAMHRNGISSTFTVRRISANNIGVEKVFPYYSPVISGVTLLKRGKVRRAKLYYVRSLIGKAARLRELVLTKEQKQQLKAQNTKVETP